MHGHPEGLPPLRENRLEEYEDVQEDTKLEDCGYVEVEMGVKVCKDGG